MGKDSCWPDDIRIFTLKPEDFDFSGDWDVYMTRDMVAIQWYNEMLDTPLVNLQERYYRYWRDGMSHREFCYEIIRHTSI